MGIQDKQNHVGSISKRKARLVERFETIRLVMALANGRGWSLFQLDLKFSFLNGSLEEDCMLHKINEFQVEFQ